MRQPQGFWVIAFANLFFCSGLACIITMAELHSFEPSFPVPHAKQLLVSSLCLFYSLAMVGGYLASRYGYRNAVIIGGLFTVIGLMALSVTNGLYIGLASFLVGSGLIHPNLYNTLNLMYKEADARRVAGFTQVYVSGSAGLILGIILSAYLPGALGYPNTMLMIAGLNLSACFIFIIGQHYRMPITLEAMQPDALHYLLPLVLTVGVLLLVTTYLLPHYTLVMSIQVSAWLFGLALLMRSLIKSTHKRPYYYALVLIAFNAVFWTCYFLPLTCNDLLNLQFNRMQIHSPIIAYSPALVINALSIIVMGGLFGLVWRKYASNCLAMIGLALCILCLGLLALWIGTRYSTPPVWALTALIIGCVLQSTGETLIKPISFAKTAELASNKLQSLLVGYLQATIGIGGSFSSLLFPVLSHSSIDQPIAIGLYHSNSLLIGCSLLLIAAMLSFISMKKL